MKFVAALFIGLLSTGSAFPCTCIIRDALLPDDDWAWEVLNKAEHVVHGRVIELRPGNEAKIAIAHSFKGAKHELTLIGLAAPASACGTSFALGEEFIYVLSRNQPLNLCGKSGASAQMQRAVGELLAAPRPMPK